MGIGRGGLSPAVMISHYLNVPMVSLDVSLRDRGECVSNLSISEDAYNGMKILVVDDINDTGATFNWIMNDWQSSCFSKNTSIWDNVWGDSVRFAVLVDNLSSECKIKINYTGLEVNKAEDNVWIEFPWENWW